MARSLGMRGRVWTNRMLSAFNTTTARARLGTFCWKDRLRSPVMKTWKSRSANASSRPLLMPSHPISWTVFTSWPGRSRRSRQSRHSSRSSFTSGGCQQLLLRGLDKADHLLSPHCGKSREELVDGLTAFEIVHKVLHWHSCSCEHGSPTHDLGIGVEDFGQLAFAHTQNLPLRRSSSKTSHFLQIERPALARNRLGGDREERAYLLPRFFFTILIDQFVILCPDDRL